MRSFVLVVRSVIHLSAVHQNVFQKLIFINSYCIRNLVLRHGIVCEFRRDVCFY